MGAHGLQFCEATTQEALAILHRRFGLGAPGDLRPRLAVDMLVAAFHGALASWVAQADAAGGVSGTGRTRSEPPHRHDLADRLREAVAALPASLALTTSR